MIVENNAARDSSAPSAVPGAMPAPEKRAVVTGGTGFVGSRLCRHLLAEGWSVAVTHRPGRFPGQLAGFDHSALIRCALTGDLDGLADFFRAYRPEAVFHVGGHIITHHGTADIEPLVDGNLALGLRVLEAMRRSGTRIFVNTGTFWQNRDPASLASRPVSLYAATKEAFETLLSYFVQVEGFRATTLRLFDNYGESDTREKILNLLLKTARDGTALAMSPGEQRIDLVHVDDVCRAYVRAYELLRRPGGAPEPVYGVSSGRRLTLRALADEVARVTGKPLAIEWGGRPYRPREVMVPQPNYPALPGWTAQVALEDGLRRMWDACRDGGH